MTGHPSRPTGRWRSAGRALLIGMLACGLLGTAAGADRTYTIDTDPVRLAAKALAVGDLAVARAQFTEAVANHHKVPESLFGLAEITVREGQYALAEDLYRQSLAAAGGQYPPAQAGLGLVLLRLGRLPEAAAAFDAALGTDPSLWSAHYGKARLLLAQEKWSEAKPELERGKDLRGLAHGEDQYNTGMALYLLGTGDLTGAEKAALLAMHLNPTDPEGGILVARIYEMGRNLSLAINTYEQVLATPGVTPTAPLLANLGTLYRQEQRYNEARDYLTRAVMIDSTYTPALKDLGDLYRLANQYDKAARVYLRYQQLVPDDRQVLLDLADSCYRIRSFARGAEAARSALALQPDDRDAQFQLARTGLRSDNDTTKAEAAALMTGLSTAATDSLPWQADDLVALAAWQTAQQDYAAAVGSLDRAAALDPTQPHIAFQRGVVNLRLAQPLQAMLDFQRAVELDPAAPANHLNLGIAAYQAGDLAAARAAFGQAVELAPEMTMARLLLAQVLAATDDLAGAAKEYREVLQQDPGNAKALRGLGFCRIRQADYQGAADSYRAATRAEPGNAEGWAGLGSAWLGLQNLAEAEAAYGKARAIDPTNAMLVKGTELLNQAKAAGKETQSQ
jgi:tetratricopeptide (TPR) repeat protein